MVAKAVVTSFLTSPQVLVYIRASALSSLIVLTRLGSVVPQRNLSVKLNSVAKKYHLQKHLWNESSRSDIYSDSAALICSSSDPPLLDEYRLPTNARPIHYDLCLRTDLLQLRFDGTVIIESVPSCAGF